jgi:hypothetical protein
MRGSTKIPAMREPILFLILPEDWQELIPISIGQRRYMKDNEMYVLVSEELRDDEWWRHVSFSRRDRLPSWEDLREVKDIFIGKEKIAVQVLPRKSEYVNIAPYVLNIYHRLDDISPLPDFRVFIDGIAHL